MRLYRSKQGYYYKEYRNGKKTRISRETYFKLKNKLTKSINKKSVTKKQVIKKKVTKKQKKLFKLIGGDKGWRQYVIDGLPDELQIQNKNGNLYENGSIIHIWGTTAVIDETLRKWKILYSGNTAAIKALVPVKFDITGVSLPYLSANTIPN